MGADFQFIFRNGALIKVDEHGNEIARDTPYTNVPYDTTSKESSVPSVSNMADIPAASPVDIWSGQPSNEVNNIHTQPSTSAEEPCPGEAQTPGMKILTKDELIERDNQAVAYSKALLVEGDTLVYITYPGDSRLYDSTGFEILAAPHRVHSLRLIATGSEVFKHLLGPTHQYRIKRRKGLVNRLPCGIEFVLDLTPPDEGDEAVELTAELSCSLGVRQWHTSFERCGIQRSLVTGEDEVIYSRKVASYGPRAANNSKSASKQEHDGNTAATGWHSYGTHFVDRDLDEAIKANWKEIEKSRTEKKGAKLEVPEYCPIRHRAGIARLLNVIEGKDPRLDSAPKVWTLFVLAKYFNCTTVVVDWIVTWLMADPNTRFIEILPEASCKMAFGLKNQLICRAAFAILVGEEALSLAAREACHLTADKNNTNQFCRLREDIDEDLRTRIEYASKNFASRVKGVFDALIEEKMSWFTFLPEWKKIQNFVDEILRNKVDTLRSHQWLVAVRDLEDGLRSYVQHRLFATLHQDLGPEELCNANKHRREEQYIAAPDPLYNFVNVWSSLDGKEKIFTRFYWRIVLYMEFPNWWEFNTKGNEENLKTRDPQSLSVPTVPTLAQLAKAVNKSIIEAVELDGLYDGVMPQEALPKVERKEGVRVRQSPNPGFREVSFGKVNKPKPSFVMKDWNPFASSKVDQAKQEPPNKSWNPCAFPEAEQSQSKPSNLVLSTYDEDLKLHIESEGNERVAGRTSTGWKRKWGRAEDISDKNELCNTTGIEKSMASEEKRLPNFTVDLPVRPGFGSPGWKLGFNSETREGIQNYIASDGDSQSFLADDQGSQIDGKDNPAGARTPGWWDFESLDWTEPPIVEKDLSVPPVNDMSQMEENENRFATGYEKLRPMSHPIPMPSKPSLPKDPDIGPACPFFSMSEFFMQVKDYTGKIANGMLDTHEMGFDIAVTDTLLCLSSEEFKYLPLWAGGDDDDTGGVFEDTIPVAMAGPNGPGPSFHTGFSSASAASSEFDTMSISQRTSFNTSIGVEDGFSDHIDRRGVIADDDFHSETFSEDSDKYPRLDKGKGKAVDRSGFGLFPNAPSSEVAFSDVSDTSHTLSEATETGMDMDFHTTPPEVIEFEIDEDEDDDTTKGQNSDNDDDQEWDDGGVEETFDFGDESDEEMVTV